MSIRPSFGNDMGKAIIDLFAVEDHFVKIPQRATLPADIWSLPCIHVQNGFLESSPALRIGRRVYKRREWFLSVLRQRHLDTR
jgi:hypothetical protein